MVLKRLLFLSMAAFGLFFGGCERGSHEPLRIATNVWPGYEPLYLARSMGEYDDGSVELVEMPSTTEVMRAYQNQLVHGAGITLDEALVLAQNTNDFAILAVMDYSNGADVILGRPGMDSMADLCGKKIGVENTALGAFFLSRALQVSGVPCDTVTPVPMLVDEHEQAYKAGKVDAVVTFEPVRTLLLKNGAVKLFDSSMIPGEIVDVLIVRKEFIRQNPRSVRRLLRGWFAALERIKKQPDAAMASMAARLGITPEETAASYDGLLLPDLPENRRALYGNEPGLKKVASTMQQQLLENKVMQHAVELDPLLPDPKWEVFYP